MNQSSERLWTTSFITLTLCNLLLFIGLQMTLSTLPAYAESALQASPVQVSLVTSLFALSAIASRLFSARALEKGGRNLLIFLGLAVSLVCGSGLLFRRQYPHPAAVPHPVRHRLRYGQHSVPDHGLRCHPYPPDGRGHGLLRIIHQPRHVGWPADRTQPAARTRLRVPAPGDGCRACSDPADGLPPGEVTAWRSFGAVRSSGCSCRKQSLPQAAASLPA